MSEESLKVLEYNGIKTILKNFTSSSLGCLMVERMAPFKKKRPIEISLDQTVELKKFLQGGERLPLAGLSDVKSLIEGLHSKGQPLEPLELLKIRDTLSAAESLRELFSRCSGEFPNLASLTGKIKPFRDWVQRMDRIVDRRGQVFDGASERLWKIRREIEQVRQKLMNQMELLARSSALKPFLQSSRIAVRNGRFVLQVKVEGKGGLRGILHDKSNTGSTLFVEPEEVVPLGAELEKLRIEENQEVTRILWEVSRDLLAQEEDLCELQNILAWIDFTYAKARLSIAFRMCKPRVVERGPLKLFSARHPLLLWLNRHKYKEDGTVREGERDPVVPIDIRIGDDYHLLIITGPNTGGKTVTLKTVGLLVLMAQSGIPIPASESSQIPVFQNVFADIGDEQSLQQSLSTFSSHISRIVDILRESGQNSLVLLDELGSGTDPAEGAALGIGILNFLYHRAIWTLITTHIGSLKGYAYSHRYAENASVEFDPKTLRPTFRLLIGVPGNSNALTIARSLGIDWEILEEAGRVLKEEDGESRELIRKMQESRFEAERRRSQAERIREKARGLKKKYEEQLEEMEMRKSLLTQEAEMEIDRILQKARLRLLEIAKKLKNVPKPFQETVGLLEKTLYEELSTSPLGKKRRTFINSLKKGDMLYIPRYGQRGRVKKIDKKAERILVQLGSLLVEVGFDEVTWIQFGAEERI